MATINTTTHADWIPVIMSREATVARDAMLVMASRSIDKSREVLNGGSVLDIPEVSLLVTNAVGADGSYSPQAITESKATLTINQFRESSVSVRDDVDKQSVIDAKREYSKQIGASLARYFEDQQLALETDVTQIITVVGSIDDATLRRLKQYLDDADAPASDRSLLVSPGQQNAILAIDRYASVDFGMFAKGKGPLSTGKLVPILGMEALSTTRVRRVLVSATLRTINMAWHKSAFAWASQIKVKIETQRNGLADDIIGSNLFGNTTVRPDHAATAETSDA